MQDEPTPLSGATVICTPDEAFAIIHKFGGSFIDDERCSDDQVAVYLMGRQAEAFIAARMRARGL